MKFVIKKRRVKKDEIWVYDNITQGHRGIADISEKTSSNHDSDDNKRRRINIESASEETSFQSQNLSDEEAAVDGLV